MFFLGSIFAVQAHRTEEDILDTEAGTIVALSKVGGELGKFVDKIQGLKVLDEAFSQGKSIKNRVYKDMALAQIANEFASLDEISKAIQITQMLRDKHLLSTNLGKIAQKLAPTNLQEAQLLLEKAVAIARQNRKRNEVPPVLAELAGKWVKLNQTARANALLEESMLQVEQLKKIKLAEKLQIYAEIGANLMAAGQKERAFVLFDKAYTQSLGVTDPFDQAAILAMLGGELAEKGQPEKAKLMLHKALSAAENIQEVTKKNDILSEIARNFSQAKEYQIAAEISKNINDEYFLAEGLIRTAKNHAKVKQHEEAGQLLNICIAKANSISSIQKKSMVWAKVASEMASMGKVQEATELLNKAYQNLV